MKIIVISIRPPSLQSGADARNFNLIRLLAKKYNVEPISPSLSKQFNIDEEGNLPLSERISYLIQGKIPYIEILKETYFTSEQLQKIKSADVIQLEEMNAYYLVEKYLPDLKSKVVLDTHNIDYIRFISETESKGIIQSMLGKFIAQKLKRAEIRAASKVHHLFVCSNVEKEYFTKYIQEGRVTVVPNGVNNKEFALVNSVSEGTILFMGLLSYPPNATGIKKYIEEIHPLVVRKFPDAKLQIIGKGAPQWVRKVAESNRSIQLIGYVPEVREYISRAAVCICPIYSGSGTRLKILEYMASGKPVVSTSKGAEGIDITNNVNILIKDNSEMFADAVCSLIEDEQLRSKLGLHARKLIVEQYDWDKIGNKLLNIYKKFE